MKKTFPVIALAVMGISAQAATLYLGDGTTTDISGAFDTGSQDWDSTTPNWTTNLNPTAYQTYVSGSDIVALGDLPTLTVTEDITVNNIGRETNKDDNGNRMDLNIGSGNTLTITGAIDGQPHGLDLNIRQFNINGPGNVAGTFAITNAARVLLNTGLTFSPGTEITWKGGTGNQFRFQSGLAGSDLSNLSIILEDTPQIDNNSSGLITIGHVIGSGVMDLGAAAAVLNLKNTQVGGEANIGTLTQTTGTGQLVLTNGTHTFDINASLKTADKLTVTSDPLTFGGTLAVSNIAGTVESGDVYTLFSAPAYLGSFSSFDLPEISPLSWDTSNLDVDGTISAGGLVVSNYTGSLYLGNGSDTYTNSPVTWDTTSALWGLGPVATESVYTNWIDGAIAIINGEGTTNRFVNLATNLNVVLSDLEWSTTNKSLELIGVTNSIETITITNEIRTALAFTSRWIFLDNVDIGGTFNMQNVGRLYFRNQAGVAPDTVITALDGSDIHFHGDADFSELDFTGNGSSVINKNNNRTLGSLSGNGELDLASGTTLTVNDITVGTISNVASFSSSSDGNLVMGPGTHNFTINPGATTVDQLSIGTGTLTYGGDLVILMNSTNTLALGDTFKLFNADNYTGAFNSIVMPTDNLPAGTIWIDELDTAGTISVGTPGIKYETFNFTEFNGVSTWAQGYTAYTEGSITNDLGTVLTLRISMVEHDGVTVANSFQMWPYNTSFGGLRRTTADGGNNNARLDAFDNDGTTVDKTNDEIVRFELFVSGTAVDTLTFKSLRLDSFGTGEVAEFNDGAGNTNTLVDADGSDTVSYSDALAGLTELTEANIGTWKLELASRDNANTTLNTISFDDIQFTVGYQFMSPFDVWADEFGLVEGLLGDDDKDGADNLSEFGLKGDPTNSADRGVFDVASVEQGGTNVFEYIHVERKDGSLTYSYALTDNLVFGTWVTNSGISQVGSADYDAAYNIVTNQTAADLDVKFIKLIIEEN